MSLVVPYFPPSAGPAALFADPRAHPKDDDQQALVSRLYERIGSLQVELDWLKTEVGSDD